MKHITITLTEDQAHRILQCLDWAYSEEDYGKNSDKRRLFPEEQVDQWLKEQRAEDAFIRRIQQKIKAELVKL